MEGMSSSGGLEIGISCLTGPHFETGGQKHTHYWIKKDWNKIILLMMSKAVKVMQGMQVDNTTPATITSEVTSCAAGDLCRAPMGTKISFQKCFVCNKQIHSIQQCGIELDLTDYPLIISSPFKNNSFTSEDTKQFILCFKCQRELPNDL